MQRQVQAVVAFFFAIGFVFLVRLANDLRLVAVLVEIFCDNG